MFSFSSLGRMQPSNQMREQLPWSYSWTMHVSWWRKLHAAEIAMCTKSCVNNSRSVMAGKLPHSNTRWALRKRYVQRPAMKPSSIKFIWVLNFDIIISGFRTSYCSRLCIAQYLSFCPGSALLQDYIAFASDTHNDLRKSWKHYPIVSRTSLWGNKLYT